MKITKVLVVVSLILMGLSVSTRNVSAACYGSSCNNIDPDGSGCSAITVKYVDWNGASGPLRTELRKSYNCNAKWTRVTNLNYDIRHLKARLTQSNFITNVVDPEEWYVYAQIWTVMYDGSSQKCSLGYQGWTWTDYFDVTTDPTCG